VDKTSVIFSKNFTSPYYPPSSAYYSPIPVLLPSFPAPFSTWTAILYKIKLPGEWPPEVSNLAVMSGAENIEKDGVVEDDKVGVWTGNRVHDVYIHTAWGRIIGGIPSLSWEEELSGKTGVDSIIFLNKLVEAIQEDKITFADLHISVVNTLKDMAHVAETATGTAVKWHVFVTPLPST
jgi:hypothetical protein